MSRSTVFPAPLCALLLLLLPWGCGAPEPLGLAAVYSFLLPEETEKHGADRVPEGTGTATAILLSTLGVPWETIREDYLLSNEYRREEIAHELERIQSMAAKKQGVDPGEVDMTNVEAFFVLDGSYIDGSLEQAVADYASMEGYIREGLGLTDAEVERLRAEFLEPAAD